ncbi:glycosyltransferase family 9 protein [Spirosoma gilvum]
MRDRPVRYKRWEGKQPPDRILIIRLQAIGDVIITFPFVQQLKNQYPFTSVDFLTRAGQVEVVGNLRAVDEVIAFTDAQKSWKQLLSLLSLLPKLLVKRYSVVLDLQMTSYTALIRKLLFPRAFAEFERFTAYTASDRNLQAINASGLLDRFDHPYLQLKADDNARAILVEGGWDGKKKLVIINPAGAFSSRNWPVENYSQFVQIWLSAYPDYQVIVLGTSKLAEKVALLQKSLGHALINLIGRTTLAEALKIVAKADFMLSEDSGLLHMAWALKIPSIALIGSTDKNRSAQNGSHIVILNSDDLPCGNCMEATCKWNNVPLCLSRYLPEQVVTIAEQLVLHR